MLATQREQTSAGEELPSSVQRLLEVARRQLGLDVVFLSHFGAHHRQLVAVAGTHPLVQQGRSDPLDDTFCRRIVEGRLPAVIPDARTDPDSAELPATRALDIGLHVGVPVSFSDGSLYGTVCGFCTAADSDADWRTARTLRVIAQAVAELLEPAEQERRTTEARRAALLALVEPGPRMVTQPIQRLADGTTVAVEALSRFDRTTEPVGELFASAAAVGVGVDVELVSLRAALEVAEHSAVPVAINGSVALWLDPRARDLLEGCSPADVILEVTEGQAVRDYGPLNAAMAPLRAAGVRLAVDDVGAGFAGLHHLLELRPDFLKLDASLVRHVQTCPRQQAMVAALTVFASETGAAVVAEGLEEQAERDCLQQLGVPLGQGYLLGRPA